MSGKCEIRWCINNRKANGKISVTEVIGDGAFRVDICRDCANILGMVEGMDLPDPDVVEKTLKRYKRKQKWAG